MEKSLTCTVTGTSVCSLERLTLESRDSSLLHEAASSMNAAKKNFTFFIMFKILMNK